MEAHRFITTVKKDGEISLTDIPVKEGQQIEVIVLVNAAGPTMTARELAHSDIVGLWADRDDIQDSAEYARQLRNQAEHR